MPAASLEGPGSAAGCFWVFFFESGMNETLIISGIVVMFVWESTILKFDQKQICITCYKIC